MLIENTLEERLVESMNQCLKDFEMTGALPSPVAEREYGMLYNLMGERMPQAYITLMVMNYYVPISKEARR